MSKSDSSSQPLIGASVDSVPPLAIGAPSPDSPIPEAGIVAGSAESGYHGHSRVGDRSALLQHCEVATYGVGGTDACECTVDDIGDDVPYGHDGGTRESVVSGRSLRWERPEGDISLCKGAFNIFKGNVAGGIFLTPMIFNSSGFVLGPALALPVWFMVTDCVFMLLDTKLKINHRLVQTYPQVIGFVFGRLGNVLCSVALVSSQLLYCLLYFQIFGDTVSKIGPVNSEFGSDGYYFFTLSSLLFILPSTFFSDKMGITAYISACGIVLIFTTYFICLGFSVQRIVHHGVEGDAVTSDLSQIPLYLTSILSSVEGIPVVLPVENSTRKEDKKKFPFMVLAVFGFVMCMYLGLAIPGNIAFGSSLKTTIVTALADGGFALAARICLAGIALCSYPLLGARRGDTRRRPRCAVRALPQEPEGDRPARRGDGVHLRRGPGARGGRRAHHRLHRCDRGDAARGALPAAAAAARRGRDGDAGARAVRAAVPVEAVRRAAGSG